MYIFIISFRCSASVTGIYLFPTGPGQHRACKFLPDIQMYEPGCQFVADKSQSTPVSIMYMQSLPSVSITNAKHLSRSDICPPDEFLFLYF